MLNQETRNKIHNAVNDELAYDITVEYLNMSTNEYNNPFESLVIAHNILEKLRNNYPEEKQIKYHNLTFYKQVDNVFVIILSENRGKYSGHADKIKIFNLFTYHFDFIDYKIEEITGERQ